MQIDTTIGFHKELLLLMVLLSLPINDLPYHAQSMDANQWTGIKSGRQRASSVWSANSTALRVSIAKALNQKNNLIATSRRPTTTTLLSVNPSGLRNGKLTSSYLKFIYRTRAFNSRSVLRAAPSFLRLLYCIE